MNRYPAYKHTGVNIISEIPSQWELNKFNHIAFYQEGPGLRNWQFTEMGVSVICVTNITTHGIDFSLLKRCISEEEYYRSYLHFTVQKGDFLLASSGASWGKLAEYNGDEKVILNTSTIRLNTKNNSVVNRDFIKWIIKSPYVTEQLNVLLTGSCQPNFGPTHLNQLLVVYPSSLIEQTAIATYLDQKTTQIDKLISNKQKLIDLLKEERTGIINEAVCGKGKNWGKKKLKYVAKLKSGEGITAEDITPDGNYPVYGGNGLRGYTTKFTHEGNYVLIGRQGALCGNINFAFDKFFASEHAIVVTILDGSNFYWLGELLRSMNLNQYSQASAQPGLSVEKIQNLLISVPSNVIQKNIVQFLKIETQRIDNTIAKIEKEIELMQEYRTALISEVVIGKIDVRNYN